MNFSKLLKKAEMGDAVAQYKVGLCYEKGDGVEKNIFLAFKWYEEAAEQDSVSALYRVALMYWKGEGTEEDKKLAFKIFSYLSSMMYGKASYFLARCYEKGEYVEKDEVEVRNYYLEALQYGYREQEIERKLNLRSFDADDFFED